MRRSPRPIRPLLIVACSVSVAAAARAQCPDGTPPPCGRAAVRAPAPNSVAVLVFENRAGDTSLALLAEGLADEITTNLGRIARLEVKSTASVHVVLGSGAREPRRIGRALRARYLVDGALLPGRGTVRVSWQLVEAGLGTIRRAGVFQRATDDLFGLITALADSVATAIVGELAPAERSSRAGPPTRNPGAYEHFLRGNVALGRRTSTTIAQGVAEYEAAFQLDASFSAARGRAAFGYSLLASDYYPGDASGASRDSLRNRGLSTASETLRRDSSSSDAWMALGVIRAQRDPRTYEGVREAFDHALAHGPRNAEALHLYGVTLYRLGDDSAAARMLRQALVIEPERPITLANLGLLYHHGRQFTEALRWFDSALTFEPEAYFYPYLRARARLQLGDTAGARQDALTAAQHGGQAAAETILIAISVRSGDTLAARARAARSSSPYAFASVGDVEGVLRRLEESRRPADFWWSLRAPELDPVRSDPRFQRLVEQVRPLETRP